MAQIEIKLTKNGNEWRDTNDKIWTFFAFHSLKQHCTYVRTRTYWKVDEKELKNKK